MSDRIPNWLVKENITYNKTWWILQEWRKIVEVYCTRDAVIPPVSRIERLSIEVSIVNVVVYAS